MSAGLDLEFDDIGQAIGDAVAAMCRDHSTDEQVKAQIGAFPAGAWQQLAELGVLGLATPDADGGPIELIAATEALGRAVFPGPLTATILAGQLLDGADLEALIEGRSIVSLGEAGLWPWALHADVFLEIDAHHAWRVEPSGSLETVGTVGGDVWGRGPVERRDDLGDASEALALHDAALAAYLAALGLRLVDDAAEHARTRVQFGKPIGEFQGVALPLADCKVKLDAAAGLARSAGYRIDRRDADARTHAAAARLSASRAAIHAAHTCHQSFGAIGATLEGPVYHISRRIRQCASQPPSVESAREVLLAEYGL